MDVNAIPADIPPIAPVLSAVTLNVTYAVFVGTEANRYPSLGATTSLYVFAVNETALPLVKVCAVISEYCYRKN